MLQVTHKVFGRRGDFCRSFRSQKEFLIARHRQNTHDANKDATSIKAPSSFISEPQLSLSRSEKSVCVWVGVSFGSEFSSGTETTGVNFYKNETASQNLFRAHHRAEGTRLAQFLIFSSFARGSPLRLFFTPISAQCFSFSWHRNEWKHFPGRRLQIQFILFPSSVFRAGWEHWAQ